MNCTSYLRSKQDLSTGPSGYSPRGLLLLNNIAPVALDSPYSDEMVLYKLYKAHPDTRPSGLDDDYPPWVGRTKPTYYEGPYPSIIAQARCISGRNRDGIWDHTERRWLIPPCRRKDCPRHWRLYAKRKYHRLKKQLPTYPYWRSIRLSCKTFIQKGRRFTQLDRFRSKVYKHRPDAALFCVFHRNRVADHIHALLGSVHHVDDQLIRDNWRAHFPAKRLLDWKPQFVCCKDHDSPKRWLWYCLMGRKRKPRVRPPWAGLPMRSPIKWVA